MKLFEETIFAMEYVCGIAIQYYLYGKRLIGHDCLDFDMYRFLLELFFCLCVFKIHEGHLIYSDDVSTQGVINQAVM